MAEVLKKCGSCKQPSRLVVRDGDKCWSCTSGWSSTDEAAMQESPLKEKFDALQKMVDCSPLNPPCGKCTACERQRSARAQSALEYYADRRTYERKDGPGYTSQAVVLDDKGKRARQALGK